MTYPEVHRALLARVGVYAGEGTEFRLRSAGCGFFAEFRWPGPGATFDVILLGVGDCFYLHHDINVFALGFRPRESEVGEELAYTLGLFGPRSVKE